MKSLFLQFLAPLLIISPILSAQTTPSLGLSVEIEGKADYKNNKGSTTRTKTQSRSLKIEVSTLSKDKVPGATIKWTLFGHTVKNHQLIKLKSGEKAVTVPGFGKVEFSSPVVKVTGTREHSVTVKKRVRGQTKTSSKRVPASGEEYYGYAVEVYLAGELVASKYSHPGLEKELHPGKK